MPTLTCLSAADLRQAVLRFRDALRAHQEELNRLNVYPVPDGDTGTNMALTLESVSAELQTADSMAEVEYSTSTAKSAPPSGARKIAPIPPAAVPTRWNRSTPRKSIKASRSSSGAPAALPGASVSVRPYPRRSYAITR